MRTLAIGDIHGCLTALKTLADHAGFSPEDKLVFVGDYVDRGPDSRGVIDFLIELRALANVVPIKGNHEIMMLWARESEEAREKWLSYGGDTTLESYGVAEIKEVPQEHWRFLEDCIPFYETETHIFIHANLLPKQSLVTQLSAGTIFWEPFEAERSKPHQSGKTFICGHTKQPSGFPLSVGHAICVDTGCYDPEGWLTCLDVDTGEYWQANEAGQTRGAILPPVRPK